MSTANPYRPALSLIRCVLATDSGRCHGKLRSDGERLTCDRCGGSYRTVQGVPILKPEESEDDGWFEAMYSDRSRTRELRQDFLREERDFMADLAAREDLKGRSLEIGCGIGLFADVVPGFIGLEYSLQSLLAEGFEAADRVCADATALPFGDGSMGCVFSFNTLEHVPRVDEAFAEIDRVLNPGGLLVLKPAWHCTRYTTELIPSTPYRSLNPRQKLVKALLPVLSSRSYKFATRLPWRAFRRFTARAGNPLSWGRLTPYHGADWISDADAVASLDSHEAILHFSTRGYAFLSHPTPIRQLTAGHDIVVMRKPSAANHRQSRV